MKLSRNAKKLVALTLSAALVLGGTAMNSSSASAAKKATLTLNKKTAKLTVGKKVTLKVKKKNVKSAKITWKSSKKTVASVSKKGVVTAKKAGKAKISATIKYKAKGSNKTKKKTLKCTVTVTKKTVAATKAPTPSNTPAGNSTPAPGGNATAAPTNAPGGDDSTNPGGDDATNPGGDDTSTNPGGNDTSTNPGGDDTSTNPGGDDTSTNPGGNDTSTNPGGNDTSNPGGDDATNPGGDDTSTNPGGDESTSTATPEPIVAGKWYSGSYSAELTKDGENEAEFTKNTLDDNAAVRIKDAVSFGTMTNGDLNQPALLIDCSKLVTTGFNTPAINITVSSESNIMYAESLDATGWSWMGTKSSYTASVDTAKDVYAVYLGDKNGEVTFSVSVMDAADFPKITTNNIPPTITLKPGNTTTMSLEYTANQYTYKSDVCRVYNSENYTDYEGVTFEYQETSKQLVIVVPSGIVLDKTNTHIEYTRIYANADGKEYSLTVSLSHVDDSIKVLTLESSWENGWGDQLLVSPQTLADAGLTSDNLVGSKITFKNGDAGSNFDIAFESGHNCMDGTLTPDKTWVNAGESVVITLTAEHSAILENGIYVGLQNSSAESVLLELAN